MRKINKLNADLESIANVIIFHYIRLFKKYFEFSAKNQGQIYVLLR